MNLLLHSAPSTDADLLYLGQFHAPDPFTALLINGKKIALLNALEFTRAKRTSAFDTVLPLETFRAKSAKLYPAQKHPDISPAAATIATLLAHYGITKITVPANFSAALFQQLSALNIALQTTDTPFPEREIKTSAELAAIRQANKIAAAGIAAAEHLLRASAIKGKKLLYQNRPLTSEILKTAIEIACLQNGGTSTGTIAAAANQACDPHETGHGPIPANKLIVIDVFPRSNTTHYHGDMTRTFIKGVPTDAQVRLVDTVRNAQKLALSQIKTNAPAHKIHQSLLDYFDDKNYFTKTNSRTGISTGFFHGTGHGLGLDIHESPRLSTTQNLLAKNTVVTVEPGLYYPGLGACRIEDVVQVTDKKPHLLSTYSYNWILP